MERHLATIWESVADAIPDGVALVQGGVRRTWREFDERAARLARALTDAGVSPGSKVALYLYNGPEYLESYFAALKVRAVPVNVNYRYLDDELHHLLDNADAEVLVFHASLGDRVDRVRRSLPRLRLLLEVDDGGDSIGVHRYEDVVAGHEFAPRIPRDAADITMTYTGGTTGMPKGVMSPIGQTVSALLATTPAIIGLAALQDPADVAPLAARLAAEGRTMSSLPACPLMHATGLGIGTLPALTFGGTIVLLEGRGLDAEELWRTVERERVHVVTIVGDAFARPLVRALDDGPARDLSAVQIVCSSGAMFSAEVKTALLAHLSGAMIIDFIAATEGTMGMAISTLDAPADTGRFRPNPGVKVLDEHDREVVPGSGEAGMVVIRDAVAEGYYKDAEKTESTFRVIGGVRHSIPGDWATVDADGSISLLGRGSQCINTGGEKVFPEEVEEAIKRHPSVEDCLVFGVVDERFGQRVVAVASLVTDALSVTGTEIIDTLRTDLSSYKLPRELVLVALVPRAPNGKADYPSARGQFGAAR